MSYSQRALPSASHIRPSSGLAGSNLTNSTHTSALQTRINEKKAELESLKQLRDLSAGLAGQMQQLEAKLATLSNGTQAVAEVLSNWNSVLRAIYMASTKLPKPAGTEPTDGEAEAEKKPELPQTLVRIPVHQAEAAQKAAEAAAEAAGE